MLADLRGSVLVRPRWLDAAVPGIAAPSNTLPCGLFMAFSF